MPDFREYFEQLLMERSDDPGYQMELIFFAMKAFYPKIRLPTAEDIDGMCPENIAKLVTALNPEMLPKPSTISLSEIKRIVAGRSRQIFQDWDRLNDILRRRESLLITRWISKPRDKRKKILHAAWPNMSTGHRHDFQARWKETFQRTQMTNARDAYLLPFINMEDLLKPKNLLLLFNSRGHNKPDVFSHVDYRSVLYATHSESIQVPVLQSHTMFLCGRSTPQTYGELVPTNEVDVMYLEMSGITLSPGEGLLVLELQEKLLRFLVKVAESILHDQFPMDGPIQPPDEFSLAAKLPCDPHWPSIAAATAEAPYRAPVQMDFVRLNTLLTAKRTAIEDHIWSLREDPGYFRDVFLDYSEHSMYHIRSKDGRQHPSLGTDTFWERALSRVLFQAYFNLCVWDLLQRELVQLSAVHDQYAAEIVLHQKLPAEYEEELFHLYALIFTIFPMMMFQLKTAIHGSPPLRNHFFYTEEGVNMKTIRRNPDRPDYLLWLIETIVDEDEFRNVGMDNLLDELDRVMESGDRIGCATPQNERISTFVAALLSDLAVFNEIRSQILRHQPGIGVFHVADGVTCRVQERIQLLDKVAEASGSVFSADKLITLTKLEYPFSKRRTAATTQKMRHAEDALDSFWNSVDEYSQQKVGITLHELLADILTPRQLNRTAEWIDPVPTLQPEISTNVIISTFDLEERTQRTLEPTAIESIKVKIKTKGPISEQEGTDNVAGNDRPPQINRATVTVGRRALRIFSILFNNPDQHELPGEVSWNDFLHALSSAGFSVEKQRGSAWLFIPPSVEGWHPIIFHEPHPSSKIPIQIALRHGRRLMRSYGWTSQTFIRAKAYGSD